MIRYGKHGAIPSDEQCAIKYGKNGAQVQCDTYGKYDAAWYDTEWLVL